METVIRATLLNFLMTVFKTASIERSCLLRRFDNQLRRFWAFQNQLYMLIFFVVLVSPWASFQFFYILAIPAAIFRRLALSSFQLHWFFVIWSLEQQDTTSGSSVIELILTKCHVYPIIFQRWFRLNRRCSWRTETHRS